MSDNDVHGKEKLSRRGRNVAIGSVLAVFLTIGPYMTMSVYLVPFSEKIGVSVGDASLLFSVNGFLAMIVALFFGSLFKKLKVKQLVLFAGVVEILGFVLLYLACVSQNVYLLWVGGGILGFTTVSGGMALAQTCITLWFDRLRGTLIGLLNVAIGIAGVVLSPMVAIALQQFDISIVLLVQGIVFGVLFLVTGLCLLSQPPEAYGMKPYGYEETEETADLGQPEPATKSLSVKQMVMTVPFWLIMIAVCLASLVGMGYQANASAFYQSIGTTAVEAALGISVFSAVMIGWSFLFGLLVDKMGPRFATILFSIAGIIAFSLAGTAAAGISGMIVVAVLMGSVNSLGILAAVSLPRIFGTENAGNIVGFGLFAGSLGSIFGTPMGAFMYTNTGSYSTFMLISAALVAIVVICAVIALRKNSAVSVKVD